jgi:hypothetical protein
MPGGSTTPLGRFMVERISDHGNLRSIQDSRHNLDAAGDVIRLFHQWLDSGEIEPCTRYDGHSVSLVRPEKRRITGALWIDGL